MKDVKGNLTKVILKKNAGPNWKGFRQPIQLNMSINCVYQVMFEEHVWNVFAVSLSD